jgi:hypothetical protein
MRVLVALLVAGLVAVVAGCGGGSKSGVSSTRTLVGSTSSTKPTTSSEQPKFASAKNCRDLAGLASKVAAAVTATSGDPMATLKTEAQQMQALASAAPSGVRDDFETFAAAFSSFLHTLDKAGYKAGSNAPPTAAQVAALTKAAKSLNTPKLQHAEQHLSAWASKNCKGVHIGG